VIYGLGVPGWGESAHAPAEVANLDVVPGSIERPDPPGIGYNIRFGRVGLPRHCIKVWTLVQPAFFRALTCKATVWSLVLTRA